MAINERLKASEYLFDYYKRASDNWNNFKVLQRAEYLRNTAIILCQGHQRLQNDHVFWAALNDLPVALQEHRNAVEQTLYDLDSFLAKEEEILRSPDLNLGVGYATRLVSDMAVAINMVRNHPDGNSVENLRNRARTLQDAVCSAREISDDRRKDFFRGLRIVSKGLLFVTGGAVVVANLTAAGVAPPIAWGSALVGFTAMAKQIDEN